MSDIKKAVEVAFNFIKGLYDHVQLQNLLLEEVKLSEDGSEWHVILGFDRDQPFVLSSQVKKERTYKLIIIDAVTYQPTSLTIYNL